MNLEIFNRAIKEHSKINIQFIDENQILINGSLLQFSGNMVKSKLFSMRYKGIKSLFSALQQAGIIDVNMNAAKHIINRYRHLYNEEN
jgi:hypothetical protein